MTDQKAMDIATQDLIEPYEGWSSFPYQDSTGVWSIGYGFTHTPDGSPITKDTPPISKQTAQKWLDTFLRSEVLDIDSDVDEPLTDNQEAALIDFIYNVGEGNFEHSTLLKLINQKKYESAAAQFERWDHAGGKELAGLLRRRLAERKIFDSPEV